MKNIKYLLYILLTLPLMTACSDNDNDSEGNPVITIGEISQAQFGDSVTVNVNCKDEGGIALSTLKASLKYGEEEVENVTLRTKTEGEYSVRLFMPLYKNVPDGKANITFTLQNIRLKKTQTTCDIALTRPHYSSLKFVASDSTVYTLLPDATNPYLFKGMVTSATKTINGYIIAPAQGSNGNQITFGQGNSAITQGVTDNISFVNEKSGTFEVSFNTLTYEYTPVYDPSKPLEIVFTSSAPTYVGDLIQGHAYTFNGDNAVTSSNWFYDPDFFTKKSDGTYTFNGTDGIYTIKADFANNGFRIWAMKDKDHTASLAADGTGALWLIGSDCFGKPGYAQVSGQSWWTDTDHALCLSNIKSKVYQITFTVGRQLKTTDINFKFFGQAGWGTEFKGTAATYHLSTESTVFGIGTDTGGHDDGNIYLKDGQTLTVGDTYVFTVDLSSGCSSGVLTVTKQ
jgi:hypothetical protein